VASVNQESLRDGYLREQDLADKLDKHHWTLKRWRDLGIGPPFILLGNEPLYSIDGARRWLAGGGTAAANRPNGRRRHWAAA
jgi:hypothetical protein